MQSTKNTIEVSGIMQSAKCKVQSTKYNIETSGIMQSTKRGAKLQSKDIIRTKSKVLVYSIT